MKRFLCVLLVLAMTPCAAALADVEEWPFYESELEYTIQYPDHLMEMYDIPDGDEEWNSDVFVSLEGEKGVSFSVTRADESVWEEDWPENGFPDFSGGREPMNRVETDEPDIWLEVSMEAHYGLFESGDGTQMAQMIALSSPTDDPDYVILLRYPADDPDEWEYIFSLMLETIAFPYVGTTGGAFVLRYEFTGDADFDKVTVDEDAEAIWLYAEPYVTDFALESVEWNDEDFTISGVTPLYTADRLAAEEKVLCIFAEMPDMMPTLRIRGTDEEGTEEIWYISESGMDGSLILLSEADLFY